MTFLPSQLEFVDLTQKEATGNALKINSKELLVLFLERHYKSGLPQNMAGEIMDMVFRLMKRETAQLGHVWQ